MKREIERERVRERERERERERVRLRERERDRERERERERVRERERERDRERERERERVIENERKKVLGSYCCLYMLSDRRPRRIIMSSIYRERKLPGSVSMLVQRLIHTSGPYTYPFRTAVLQHHSQLQHG